MATRNGGAPPVAKRARTEPSADHSGQTKRLQGELRSLIMSADKGISAFPDEDTILRWGGTVVGAEGTVYAGQTYKLRIQFPADYPYTAPTVTFVTPIFHPNVDAQGNVCVDILQDKWSPAYNVRTLLLSLQSLLGEPNNDSPLNVKAAQIWGSPEFEAEVKKLLDH